MNRRIIIILGGILTLVGITLLVLLVTQRDEDTSSVTPFDENRVPTRIVTDPSTIEDGLTEQPPAQVLEAEQNFYRVNVPDVFVANLTPFENDFFSIRDELVDNGEDGEFVFFVQPKTETTIQAQDALVAWLLENGLTTDQIGELTISFE